MSSFFDRPTWSLGEKHVETGSFNLGEGKSPLHGPPMWGMVTCQAGWGLHFSRRQSQHHETPQDSLLRLPLTYGGLPPKSN